MPRGVNGRLCLTKSGLVGNAWTYIARMQRYNVYFGSSDAWAEWVPMSVMALIRHALEAGNPCSTILPHD